MGEGFGSAEIMTNDQGQDAQNGGAAPARLRDEARAWLVRLSAGDMEPQERARFERWLNTSPEHRNAFAHEQAMWRQADHFRELLGPSSWAAPDNALAAAGEPEPASPRQRPRLPSRLAAGLALAACLVLAVFGGDIWLALTADFRTGPGEQRQVELPDGSVALLNTNSAIGMDFTANKRRIALLRGEAYFTVAKNPERPFTVLSRDRLTRAVGTAFAVRDDHGEVSVTVTEGRVAVMREAERTARDAEPRQVALTADQQTVYRNGGRIAPVRRVDAHALLAWREGKIIVDDMPFEQAIAELDRYRPGRIVIASLASLDAPVSGVFSSGRLESAIGTLAATQGLRVRRITPWLTILH